MRSNGGRGAIASAAARIELAAEFLFDGGEKLLKAPGVEHIFQPRLGAVGAIAVLDEYAHHRVGRPWSRRSGFTITPVSRAKSLWPVMPPSIRRNQTPGSMPKPSFTSTA